MLDVRLELELARRERVARPQRERVHCRALGPDADVDRRSQSQRRLHAIDELLEGEARVVAGLEHGGRCERHLETGSEGKRPIVTRDRQRGDLAAHRFAVADLFVILDVDLTRHEPGRREFDLGARRCGRGKALQLGL